MYLDDLTFPIVAPKAQLDFYDVQTIQLAQSIAPYQAYLLMTDDPPVWLKAAFYLRDIISRLGKVQPIQGFGDKSTQSIPKTGDKIDFFDVVEINDERLILQATDRHLSVMMAFIKNTDNRQSNLSLVGSVKTHNFFGKLYMLPVAPAHKIIVKSMFKKLR